MEDERWNSGARLYSDERARSNGNERWSWVPRRAYARAPQVKYVGLGQRGNVEERMVSVAQ